MSPLEAFLEDARSLSDRHFARRHAEWFFVADPTSVFSEPAGPVSTMRVSLAAVAAARDGRFHGASEVFAVERRDDSPFRFISVGRTANCDVSLPDESVSKLHAIVREEGDALTLNDAGSANGTRHNDQSVAVRGKGEPTVLRAGDEVQVGTVKLHVFDAAGLRALVLETLGDEDGDVPPA